MDDVAEVGGEDKVWQVGARQLLVSWLESILDVLWQVEHENWLVNLHRLGACCLELLQQLDVDWQKLLKEFDWLHALATVGLAKV